VSLAGGYLIPWTLQYFVGGGLALVISSYLLLKNPKSWVYRYFFLFGFSVSMWEFLAFFHRNAPTADLSVNFFVFDMFFYFLSFSFLLITLLTLRRGKLTYALISIPAFIVAIFLILAKPFDIFWTDFGWNFKFVWSISLIPYMATFIGYIVSIIIVGGLMIKESKVAVLRKKIVLILTGFIIFYLIGLTTVNLFLAPPNFPPLGGIFTLLTFLFISYAIVLPRKKIETLPIRGVKKFSEDYLHFLNKILDNAPGRGLGQNLVALNRFLEITGLDEAVSLGNGEITLNSNKLNSMNLLVPAEKVLEYLEAHDWATEARAYYKDVFINTYLTTRKKSRKIADDWFKEMVRKHSGFFSTYGIMDAIPEDVELPKDVLDVILKSIKSPRKYRLKGGIIYFIRENGVEKGYKFFTGLAKYSRTLCLTDTNPLELREIYGLKGVPIVRVTFERYTGGKTISPNKLGELTTTISRFFGKGKGAVFVDCIDSMVMANGFKLVMGWLKGVKKIMRKSKSNLLVTIDPNSFSNRQLAEIRKGTENIKV